MKSILLTMLLSLPVVVPAHPSVSILMDSKGNVYFSDLAKVWKISSRGIKSVVVDAVHTHELYLDKEDNLFGEHLWYNGDTAGTWGHYVWKLSPTGKFEKIKPDTPGILTNYGFTHDGTGNMYWPDREKNCQHVVRKNQNGSIAKLGESCLTNIRWITASTAGNLFVVDFHDLKKIDVHGNVTILAKDLPDKKQSQSQVNEEHYLGGLTTDNQENVYVADFVGRVVKKVDARGRVSRVTQTSIPWAPAGTLVAPNGDFWILECSDTNEVRVEKISPDGSRTVY